MRSPTNGKVISPASSNHNYHRYPEIGKSIGDLIHKNKINRLTLSCALSVLPSFEVAPRTVLDSLKLITAGYIFGKISSDRQMIHPQLHLERIANIIYTLGVNEEDGIIASIREITESFSYPPINGISYNEFISSFDSAKYKNGCRSKVYQLERRMGYLNERRRQMVERFVEIQYTQQVAEIQKSARRLCLKNKQQNRP